MSNSKEKLAPLVEKFTNLLMQDLLEQKVVHESITSDGIKAYTLLIKLDDDLNTSATANVSQQASIDNILDLRDLSRTIYNELNTGVDIDKIAGHVIMKYFVDKGAIEIPNFSSTRVQDILSKAKTLLQEEDVQKEAIELLDIQNRNFEYINSLLEYFVTEMIKRELKGYTLEGSSTKQAMDLVLIANTIDINEPTILFEIKYRKRALNSLRDDLFSAVEKMVTFGRTNKKDTFLTLVIFTDEGSQAIEKVEYRFKQYVEESFPSYAEQIFLIPLYIKNSHLLKSELQKLVIKVTDQNSKTIEFKLQDQENQANKPEIDDHVYQQTFDVTRYLYEIRVVPKSKMLHWRFGLRFSKNTAFPELDGRHEKGYHLIHLEKNTDTNDLLVSTYDASAKQILYGSNTTLRKYDNEPFIFLVSIINNQTKIDIVDKNRESVLDQPLFISNYPYFNVSAWADRKNNFEFDVVIRERKLKIPIAYVDLVERQQSENVTILVNNDENQRVSDCHILLLAENNTYHEGRTSVDGILSFNIPVGLKYTLLAAHEKYPSAIVEQFDSTQDVIVTLQNQSQCGSVIASKNWVNIPGIDGEIDAKLDKGSHKYLYTHNIAVDGGKQEPVYFEINEPLLLEDRHNQRKKIIVRFIRGKISAIDFF